MAYNGKAALRSQGLFTLHYLVQFLARRTYVLANANDR